ncbi:MAG: low molecular weight phosphotyrosine protein phosphatase [Flavobacteriales bacterium]|nr:low molecular weight phosphotyrosine protein phosphatase [Flavobacteriales bacterium]HRH70879.1 low molecular weight protein-tyrosine-phosphatase [Flavobacteriales bacterium]
MKLLLVCLGNICRSPMAEGILRDMIAKEGLEWSTDSAGTGDYHVGEAPDKRAIKAMRDRDIDISDLRARQLRPQDFEEFDLLLAMDASNLRNMRAIAPNAELVGKARLMMDFAPDHALREVPDPYFGGDEGFREVYEMLTIACRNLMKDVQR